jgi:hypothetical protein
MPSRCHGIKYLLNTEQGFFFFFTYLSTLLHALGAEQDPDDRPVALDVGTLCAVRSTHAHIH